VGQTRTLIQLIQDRSAIQEISSGQMKEKFAAYHLELKEVLIGTPASHNNDKAIEQILVQLRSRQIAEEQVETYGRQEKAAAKERELREAESKARIQNQLTESELSINIQSNQGKADYQRSVQQAAQIRALAEAESDKMKMIASGEAQRVKALAEAEAEKAARVGIAQALAIEEQVRAYGGPQRQLTREVMDRFSQAIEQSKVDVVPKVMISGQGGAGTDGGQGSVFQALLALMLSDKFTDKAGAGAARDPKMDEARDRIRSELMSTIGGNGAAKAPAQKR
jgi:uncharacterized membrane protein YqiK